MSLVNKIKGIAILSIVAISSLNAQIFGLGDDCCPGPLCPCAFGVQAKGGIAPTFFTDPDTTYLVIPGLFPVSSPLFPVSSGDDFDDYFDLPWIVGGELSYNVSDHVQLFLEGMYRQGDAKNRSFTFPAATPIVVSLSHDDFRTWGLYVGGRYFLNRWDCLCIAPFVGAKIGFQQHRHIDASVSIAAATAAIDGGSVRLYESNYALSVGVQAGFDYAITDCLSLVFTVEGVFTSPLRPNHNAVLPGTFGVTNIIFGETGTDISVPVTLGLRWDF